MTLGIEWYKTGIKNFLDQKISALFNLNISMIKSITPIQLQTFLSDQQEIALFDVREHGQYGEGHLFFGCSLPYSRLEFDIARLAPRKNCRIVIYDQDGKDICLRAAVNLQSIGYSHVSILEGGASGWAKAGFTLFAGVNLPSKTFGELVEHQSHTPRLTVHQVAAMINAQESFVLLDGRPLSEFKKMSLPTAICCPNGELAYRISGLVKDVTTPIVVNCAGRTRSIIGAQTLINLGLPNPIYALENGTQGWYLNDYLLEHGKTQDYPSASPTPMMRTAAKNLATRVGVVTVSAQTVQQWAEEKDRSVFLCDVRTEKEFLEKTLPRAQHTPGGQFIQATDQYVGVRNARIVLFDADDIRAYTTASWLKQMGHDVSVLDQGLKSALDLSTQLPSPEVPNQVLPSITCTTLREDLASGNTLVIDLRPSMQFRLAAIPNSQWSIRPNLLQDLQNSPTTKNWVIVSDDPGITDCAARELFHCTTSVKYLSGGFAAWQNAGFATEKNSITPADKDCIDFLFFVHDRHDGNKASAARYLAWETGLISQLDAQELASFQVLQCL